MRNAVFITFRGDKAAAEYLDAGSAVVRFKREMSAAEPPAGVTKIEVWAGDQGLIKRHDFHKRRAVVDAGKTWEQGLAELGDEGRENLRRSRAGLPSLEEERAARPPSPPAPPIAAVTPPPPAPDIERAAWDEQRRIAAEESEPQKKKRKP